MTRPFTWYHYEFWPWILTYFWKNFNLGCYLVMVAARLLTTLITSSLKLLDGILRNFTGSRISTSSTGLCFPANRKTKMAAQGSDWLKLLNRIQRNFSWRKARSQCPLPCLCYSGWSENQDGHPDWSVNYYGVIYLFILFIYLFLI